MRLPILIVCLCLAACSSPPSKPAEPPRADPTQEAWYPETVARLQKLYVDAKEFQKARRFDEAAALVTESQPLILRVLEVPRPTLAAMEAASDLDDLYGRMLMQNRHHGSARLMFQKNVARWTHWRPQTEETARRRGIAEEAVRECDRQIERR